MPATRSVRPGSGRPGPARRPRAQMPAAGTYVPRVMRGGRRGWNQPATRPASPAPVTPSALPVATASDAARDRRLAPAAGRGRSRRRPLVAVVLAAAVLVGVAGLGVWAVSSLLTGTSQAPNADLPALDQLPSPSLGAVPPPSVTDPACPSTAVGAVSWGKDAGGTDTGVEAIKKFDYGYYVTRSGVAAREAVAPDALVGDAASLQSSIDAMPPGTTHCLQITDRGNGTYVVRLAEFRPNAEPELTFQVIQTARQGGRTVITAIPTNVSIGR